MSSKLVLRLIEVVGVAMLISGCYREEIAELHNQMDDFTEVHINPIEAQISGMNSAIDSLRDTRDALQEQIAALEGMRSILEGRISQTNSDLQELIKRVGVEGDDESGETLTSAVEGMKTRLNTIDQAISDLQTKDAAIDSSINSLKAAVQASNDSLKDWVYKNMEAFKSVSDVLGAIEGDILSVASSLDDFKVDITNAVADSLKSLAERIEMNYNSAISDARNSILNVINDVDSSIRNWVIDTLETSYYDKASIDQFLANIQGGLESKDSIILNKIDSLRDDLAETEQRITDAYGQAITDAVNGIEAKISDLGDIRAKLNSVDSVANATAGALLTLTGRVNTLEQQAEVIKGDIVTLKSMDSTILAKIDSLGGISSDEIDKLKGADTTLQNLIDDLQAYVDGDLTNGFHDWVSQSYATLDRQNNLADSLAAVFSLLGMSPDGLGGWIGAKFNDYFTIAQVTDSLSKLRSELTSNYKSYIADAIENGGIIGKAIADSISAFKTYINGQLDSVKARLTALENVVQSVVFVPEYDDGKIFIPSEYNESTKKYSNPKKDIVLSYKINTKNSGFDPKNYDITGDLIDAKSATKVVYAGQKIAFDKIEYNKEKSLLAVTFNSKVIPDWFFDESKSAAMSLTISDDNTELTSSYIGLRLEKVAGGGGGGGGEDPVGNFRVDPAAISVGNQGGITTAMVLAVSDFTWSIKSKPNWVDVQVIGYSLLSQYNGTQFISVAISKNTSDEARDGEVVFSEVVSFSARTPETATLKIHQEKREPQTIDISPSLPSEVHFDWEGYTAESTRSYVYRVTPSDQMSDWTVSYSNSASWLHVTQSESLGAGVRDVTITVDRRAKTVNGYYTEGHEADVVFSSVSGDTHTVHVVQDFRPKGELIFTPSQMSYEFEWDDAGNTKYEYTLQPTDSLSDWKYRTINPFNNYFDCRGYGSPDRVTGKGSLNIYTKSKNTTFEPRTGQISFTTADGQTNYIFTATQKARPSQTVEFSPNTNPVEFDWEGKRDGKTSYDVAVITSDNITDWEYSKDADWFSVRTSSNKASLQVYNVGSFEKSEDEYREGHITVRPAGPNDEYKEANKIVLTVKQYKRPEQILTLGIEKGTSLEFRWDAATPKVEPKQVQTYEISVDPGDGRNDWKYYLPDNKTKDDYFTVTKIRRSNVDHVIVSVNGNNNKSDLVPSTTLTIESATGQTYEFPLKQNARLEQTLEFNPASGSSFNFGWKGGTDKLTVTSSDKLDDWKVNGKPTWLTFEKGQNNDGVVEVSIAVGEDNQGRECTIEIVNGNGNKVGEFTVAQDARPAQTFNPSVSSGTEIEFYKNGTSRETGETSVTINLNPSDTEYDYSVDKSRNSNWCTVDNPKDGTLTFSVDNYSSSGSRNCTVTIKSATESQTVTYTIIQKKTYIVSDIPATSKAKITSGAKKTYKINAYGEGCKIYYNASMTYGSVVVSGIGSNAGSATDISEDVSVDITATKKTTGNTTNGKERLSGNVTFHILDSDGNEIDSMQVDYSYDYSLRDGYTYYVQAQI